jgi:hypothetical protein
MARVAVLVVLSRGVSGGKLHSDAVQSPRLGSKITQDTLRLRRFSRLMMFIGDLRRSEEM